MIQLAIQLLFTQWINSVWLRILGVSIPSRRCHVRKSQTWTSPLSTAYFATYIWLLICPGILKPWWQQETFRPLLLPRYWHDKHLWTTCAQFRNYWWQIPMQNQNPKARIFYRQSCLLWTCRLNHRRYDRR